jgi:hypothetical protein
MESSTQLEFNTIMPKQLFRIAVAVNAKGDWNAAGWGNAKACATKQQVRVTAIDGLDVDLQQTEEVVWLEAYLDLPSDKIEQFSNVGEVVDVEPIDGE